MKTMSVLLCLCPLIALATASHPINLPIQIDGDFADWPENAQIGTDPPGDGGPSGIDFTRLYAANDDVWAFLRFDTTVEIQGDEDQSMVIALDTDQDPGTGFPVGSIGAELVWRLGERTGFVYPAGSPIEIDHPSLGLVLGPTVSDVEFELSLSRSATPAGMPLFPSSGFDIYLWDDDGGDSIGPFLYAFEQGEQPVPSIPLNRQDPNHVRVCAYNVENDGLFSGGEREAALNRIMDAVDPDIVIFCEVWDHSAEDVAERVEEFLPSDPGEGWEAVKLDAGNVVVARFPILDAWLVFPGSRLTAVLLDVRPRYDSDLLVVANHWSCCDADQNRQAQADALIAFLRDARTPGGLVDLALETPIVAAGDFNLVGWRRQLETLVTGDIQDNATWGPDSPPDWDGSDFDIAMARHPDARFVYTWRNDASSFYPGKLDYFCYTGSVATLHNNYTVETRNMSPTSLDEAGLLSGDTEIASDHAPIVADLSVNAAVNVAVGDTALPSGTLMVITSGPNPFREGITLSFELAQGGPVTLSVYDASGRLVRDLLREPGMSPGRYHVSWDGRDDAQRPVSQGAYWYQLRAARGMAAGRWILLR